MARWWTLGGQPFVHNRVVVKLAFIVGGLLIGAGATVAGAAISSSGAKKAAKTAAAGSDREIEFNRESRDLARADQAPYREAGNTALDALMSLTGLGGGSATKAAAPGRGYERALREGNEYGDGRSLGGRMGSRASGYAPIHARYDGGPTNERGQIQRSCNHAVSGGGQPLN